MCVCVCVCVCVHFSSLVTASCESCASAGLRGSARTSPARDKRRQKSKTPRGGGERRARRDWADGALEAQTDAGQRCVSAAKMSSACPAERWVRHASARWSRIRRRGESSLC
ncbi:hypothetical protein GGS23DRAFT_425622 [Durotheca rogersii]|uniref:uncharacterized protein n=1 Tax=Durotheca rogersii TaxID=419775 RepID=UPI00221E4E8D|nr:uncharacterized protein GGS23DRAFT_425622 [Durotheca rogersii]KAI5865400.1 hypothetical protein GGS23DRAFT_425622 [Durotheca rogersii]